jgi:hypothetical protein
VGRTRRAPSVPCACWGSEMPRPPEGRQFGTPTGDTEGDFAKGDWGLLSGKSPAEVAGPKMGSASRFGKPLGGLAKPELAHLPHSGPQSSLESGRPLPAEIPARLR